VLSLTPRQVVRRFSQLRRAMLPSPSSERFGPWGDIFRGYFAFTVRYGPMTCSPSRRWLCQ